MKYGRRVFIISLVAPFLVTFLQGSSPRETAHTFAYKSGFSAIIRLGRDLYNGLKPAQQERIYFSPVVMDTNLFPYVRLTSNDEADKAQGVITVSVGFVDLVNRVAHAAAIERLEKGYFRKYMNSLTQMDQGQEVKELPGENNPRYWSDDVLNEQLSNFNSIVGVVLGINLAHHYLGHYARFESQLSKDDDDPSQSINELLSLKEWEEVSKSGVLNSLRAGCAIEGILPFYEVLDRMDKRPPWAHFFLPDKADFKALRKTLMRLQSDYFAGKIN